MTSENVILIAIPTILFLFSIIVPPIRKSIYQKPWLTILTKNLYTMFGKPYFKVSVFHHQSIGQVGVDAQYNIHFLYLLDAAYEEAKVEYYNKSLSEEGKIAIYLYDTMGSIADNYMPMPSEIQDMMDEDIPGMSLSDNDKPVKQVVDLGGTKSQSGIDIAQG